MTVKTNTSTVRTVEGIVNLRHSVIPFSLPHLWILAPSWPTAKGKTLELGCNEKSGGRPTP